MKVTVVLPHQIEGWKETLAWHFDEFTKGGDLTIDTLWGDVASKERQCFVVENPDVQAVVLTCVAPDEHKTFCVTHAAGYDRHAWQHLWPILVNVARDAGSTAIRAIARPGWERILKAYDMRKTHVILEGSL